MLKFKQKVECLECHDNECSKPDRYMIGLYSPAAVIPGGNLVDLIMPATTVGTRQDNIKRCQLIVVLNYSQTEIGQVVE